MAGSRAIRAVLLPVVLVVAGCVGHVDGTPPPSRTPDADQVPRLDGAFLGCANVTLGECNTIGRAAEDAAHGDRPGAAVVIIEIELSACGDEAGCGLSANERSGRVTVEFDGREPAWYEVSGDPADPTLQLVTGECPPLCWELSKARSEVVTGAGPFAYTLSHCGINHFVDFDNSWWVVVGETEGQALSMRAGEIRLLGRDLAEFRQDNTDVGYGTYVASLARFPDPKYIWQACA